MSTHRPEPTTNPGERLADLKALRDAVASHRASMLRVVNDRTMRTRRAHNAVTRIRALRKALLEAVKELRDLYYATRDLPPQIDALGKRVRQLDGMIAREEQRARVKRLLDIKAKMEALNLELPEELKLVTTVTLDQLAAGEVAPAEADLSEDPDDDVILS